MIATRRTLSVTAVLAAALAAYLGASPDVDRQAHSLAQPDGLLGDARILMLLAAIGLVAAAPGLRRGRRGAWWVATAAAAVVGVASTLDGITATGLAFGAATTMALVATRAAFAAPLDGTRVTRALAAMLAGLAGVFAYAAVGTYFLDANFRESTTAAGSLYDAARMIVLLPTSIVIPATAHGAWFVDSVHLLAFVVVLVGLVRVSVAVVTESRQRDAQRHHVAELLAAYGDSALAPFLLLADKSWVFAPDGKAVIGYRVVGETAVALGGPVGAAASRASAVRAFRAHCLTNGWVPAFHQVRDDDRDALEAEGFRYLKIGEEAVVPLAEFTLAGSSMRSVRSTLKRVERVGSRFAVLAEIDDATMDELRAVSDAWLATGGHRERAFSVGRFDPDELRATTVAVVRDAHGQIIAFANILPAYRSGLGNVDLMRRRPDCVNGVMDFLFVRLIEHFRACGLVGMTLGLAPLAGVEGSGVADRVLRAVRTYGGATFNFDGLREFKSKWHPAWEDRYVAYRRERDLPAIALGIARVGEVPPTRPRSRVVDLAASAPLTAVMLALAFWVTMSTSLDGHVQRILVGTFGLSWPDLTRGEVWRVWTSSLISPRAGFVWSNLVLLVIVLPLAERRLGTIRAAVVFFAGDVTASLLVLAALRVAAGLGSGVAATNLATRDVGQSAGAWALAAALAATAGRGRPRAGWAAGVAIVLLGQLVLFHRLFDLQHVLAALAGATLAVWWSRQPAEDGAAAPRPRAALARAGARR